jgi:hypothetical protein
VFSFFFSPLGVSLLCFGSFFALIRSLAHRFSALRAGEFVFGSHRMSLRLSASVKS